MKFLSTQTFQCGITVQGSTTLAGTTYLTGITNTASWDYVVVGTSAQGQLFTRTYAQLMSDISSGITLSLDGLSDVVAPTPLTGQLLRYNGVQWANWTPTYYSLPAGGTTLQYIDGTGALQTFPINLPTSSVKHQVKASVAINKGQAVYVTGADGTNMIVGLASNASEATSSKTMGLLDATVSTNGFANVVTEGLLAGLDTSTAGAAGDPVWLGTGGNLIYGLGSKPYAPANLVFIGIVTRKNNSNGEIFVKVQNGFELNESHDVDLITTAPINGHLLGYNGTLWVNKTIAGWLGYTPANASGTTNYISKFTGSTTLGNSQIFDNGTNVGIGTTSPGAKLDIVGTGNAVQIRRSNGYASIKAHSDNGGNLILDSDTSTGAVFLNNYVNRPVYIATGGGNVGIGTTNPIYKLDVNGSFNALTSGVYLTYNSGIIYHGSSYYQFPSGSYYLLYGRTGMGLIFGSNNAEVGRFDLSGNLGIGTTAPVAKLEISSVASNVASILASDVYARASFGQQGNSGDAHFGASGDGAPTIGLQDYGFYAAHNAFRSSTGAWKHSRTATVGAVRLLGSGGVSSGNQGFSFDYSANVGTADIAWTNLMQILPSGNVGIGTTAPNRKLHVESSGVIADFKSTTTQGLVDIIGTSNQLRIGTFSGVVGLAHGTGTSPHITIASGGNVGIGTTSPGAKLDVAGNLAADTVISIEGVDTGNPIASGDELRVSGYGIMGNRGGLYFTNASAVGNIQFGIGGTHASLTKMYIQSDGNVGIGTTTPEGLLQISRDASTAYDGTNDSGQSEFGASLTIQNTNTTLNSFAQVNMQVSSTSNRAVGRIVTIAKGGASSDMAFVTENAGVRGEKMRITSTGNVGIGTTSPTRKLDVNGTSIFRDFTTVVSSNGNPVSNTTWLSTDSGITNIYTGGNSTVQLNSNGVSYFNGGNVGIGTTSPTAKLTVLAASTGYSSDSQIKVSDTTTGYYGGLSFDDAGATRLSIRNSYDGTGSIIGFGFGASADKVQIIDGTGLIVNEGNVGIGTTSPSDKLHVNDTSRFVNNTTNSLGGALYTGTKPSSWLFPLETSSTARQTVIGQATTAGIALPQLNNYGGVGVIGVGGPNTGGRTNIGVFGYQYFAQTMAGNSGNSGYGGYFLAKGIGSCTDFKGQYIGVYGEGNIGTDTVESTYGSISGGKFVAVGTTNQTTYGVYAQATGGTTNYSVYAPNGNAYFADRVGIGTTSPSKKLEVVSNTTYDGIQISGASIPTLAIIDTTNNAKLVAYVRDSDATIGMETNHPLTINTNNTERVRITSGGNVGIGTTSPGYKLDVSGQLRVDNGVANGSGQALIVGGSGDVQLADGGSLFFGAYNYGGSTYIRAYDDGNIMYFYLNGTNMAYFRNDRAYFNANVGIGTSSPTQKLDVNGNIGLSGNGTGNRWILLNETNTYAGTLRIQAGAGSAAYGGAINMYGHSHATNPGDVAVGISSGSGGSFRVNSTGIDTGTDLFIVKSSGNVGIGTTTPSQILHLFNQAHSNDVQLLVENDGYLAGTKSSIVLKSKGTNGNPVNASISNVQEGTIAGTLAFYTNGANERLRITSTGNVGIGTTSPASKLHINQTSATDYREQLAKFTVSDAGNDAFFINNGTSADNTFWPAFVGYGASTTRSGIQFLGLLPASADASDSADRGVLNFEVLRTDNATDPSNGNFSAIVNRKLFTWSGASGPLMTMISTGNLGIGTTSPGAKLDVTGGSIQLSTSGSGVYFGPSSAAQIIGVSGASGYLSLGTVGTEKVRITSAGNVGIGTTSPAAKLHIEGGAARIIHSELISGLDIFTSGSVVPSSPQIRIGRGGTQWFGVLTDDSSARLVHRQDESAQPHYMLSEIWSDSPDRIYQWTVADSAGLSPSTLMVLNSTGLGIGTTSPSEKLDVYGAIKLSGQVANVVTNGIAHHTNGYVYFTGGTAGAAMGNDSYSSAIYAVDNGSLELYAGSANRLHITSGGNVGIGTTSPAQKLDVSGDALINSLRVGRGAANNINNVVLGNDALSSNVSARNVVAIGRYSLVSLTTGWDNIGIGKETLATVTDGQNNIAIGSLANSNNSLGNDNVTIGTYSMYQNTGSNNTTLGSETGYSNSAGSGNVFIGYRAGYNETGSNRLYIANSSGTPIIYGNFSTGNVGIGTISPSQLLHVAGNLRVTGAFYDSNNQAGTSGQILKSTGSGTDWVSLSEITGVDGTGTANYVTKWSDADTIANSLIYDNGTNVGIGTTSPGYNFDVNGQVRVQDKLRVGTVNSGNGVVHMSSIATINPSATTIVWAQNVSVGMCAFIEYYILNNNSLTDQRAGTIMVTWNQSGTPTIAHTETTTPDIGSTIAVNFTSSLVGSDARINAVNSSANPYTIVMSYKYF